MFFHKPAAAFRGTLVLVVLTACGQAGVERGDSRESQAGSGVDATSEAVAGEAVAAADRIPSEESGGVTGSPGERSGMAVGDPGTAEHAEGAGAAASGPSARAAPRLEGGRAAGRPTGGDASRRAGGTPAASRSDDDSASEEPLAPGDTASPRLGMGSDAVDMEASGPMVHTRPDQGPVDFPDARFARPEHVRGIYVNAWAAGSTRRMEALLDLARRTEVNSFVIDIKDATGFISHETSVPLAGAIGATGERRIRDLPALLDRLEAEGIYPIARIVVVKDPILSASHPELAVQDTAGGVWIDSKEIVWLNPFAEGVWDYHVEIAREVAEMGFPEIQWDYIRFPDAPASDMARAVFPGSEGRTRTEAIRGFLAHARSALADLSTRSTADVFGVTTSFRRDIGLGQRWESFIDVVDVALPMVYPSHYWEGSFGYREPNAYPYEVVRGALRDALRRSEEVPGAGLTRPWIQDFTLGEPMYGAAEVRAQIQAAYDVGIREWILWNPSTRYTESALEPVEGFEYEPWVRVAGVLAPVSRRHIVIDSVAALPPEPEPVDSLALPDLEIPVPVDTVQPLDTGAVDLGPARDTLSLVLSRSPGTR